MSFETNQGQVAEEVRFLSHGNGYTLFLTPTEAVLALRKQEFSAREDKIRVAPTKSVDRRSLVANRESTSLRLKLLGANSRPQIVGLEELPGKSNYFVGNDPTRWRTDVPTFAQVKFAGVYPGIDLVYYGSQGRLEYDFVVAPGANPDSIQFAVVGAEKLRLDQSGNLVLRVGAGEVLGHKPTVYQETPSGRKEIASAFALAGAHKVGFRVQQYDSARPLVIDPVLVYATYLGGISDENFNGGGGIAVDSSGFAYVTGYTLSADFPTAVPFLPATQGSNDVFVTKLNSTGTGLVYSTYLGGSSYDYGYGIAVDASGNAYVTGVTGSANFPTLNPYQGTFRGGLNDAFVTKLSASGASLVYSTYLGGANWQDNGTGIAVDSSGNAYVTGTTGSGDFPVTSGAFQKVSRGIWQAFVAKLNSSGSGLLYSTFLGGTGQLLPGGRAGDRGNAIAVDASGNAYITGTTGYGHGITKPKSLRGLMRHISRGSITTSWGDPLPEFTHPENSGLHPLF